MQQTLSSYPAFNLAINHLSACLVWPFPKHLPHVANDRLLCLSAVQRLRWCLSPATSLAARAHSVDSPPCVYSEVSPLPLLRIPFLLCASGNVNLHSFQPHSAQAGGWQLCCQTLRLKFRFPILVTNLNQVRVSDEEESDGVGCDKGAQTQQ